MLITFEAKNKSLNLTKILSWKQYFRYAGQLERSENYFRENEDTVC